MVVLQDESHLLNDISQETDELSGTEGEGKLHLGNYIHFEQLKIKP